MPASGDVKPNKWIRLILVCLALNPLMSAIADKPAMTEIPVMAENQAIAEARLVMDDFMTHFNARNEAAWASTLLFPHIRVASNSVVVTPTEQEFLEQTNLDAFAETYNWSHSAWDSIEVVQAGPDKVHFKVRFSRFNPQGERYATFDSLYVVQRVEGSWGIRARSSFAP